MEILLHMLSLLQPTTQGCTKTIITDEQAKFDHPRLVNKTLVLGSDGDFLVHIHIFIFIYYCYTILKQAISTHEQDLCQLTVCFEFQSRSERRKGHKSCTLPMDSKVPN